MTEEEIASLLCLVVLPLVAWFWNWYTYTGYNILMRKWCGIEWVCEPWNFRRGYWRRAR